MVFIFIYTFCCIDLIAPAQYWHDPYNHQLYLSSSAFLADINNEKQQKNAGYKAALSNLANLVLVKWRNDTTVIPKASSHFGYYAPGQDQNTISLQRFPLYQEDWLGLRSLDAAGNLHFIEMDGDHMQFNWTWFGENIVRPFLTE